MALLISAGITYSGIVITLGQLAVCRFGKPLAGKTQVTWLYSENVLLAMVEHKRAFRNIQCLLRPRLRTGIPFITTTPPYWPKPKSQGQARLKG